MMSRIPFCTPDHRGDKICSACSTRFNRDKMREIGVYAHGLYYVNCPICKSTITTKEDAMKVRTSLSISEELKTEVNEALGPDETWSSFIRKAIRHYLAHRKCPLNIRTRNDELTHTKEV